MQNDALTMHQNTYNKLFAGDTVPCQGQKRSFHNPSTLILPNDHHRLLQPLKDIQQQQDSGQEVESVFRYPSRPNGEMGSPSQHHRLTWRSQHPSQCRERKGDTVPLTSPPGPPLLGSAEQMQCDRVRRRRSIHPSVTSPDPKSSDSSQEKQPINHWGIMQGSLCVWIVRKVYQELQLAISVRVLTPVTASPGSNNPWNTTSLLSCFMCQGPTLYEFLLLYHLISESGPAIPCQGQTGNFFEAHT